MSATLRKGVAEGSWATWKEFVSCRCGVFHVSDGRSGSKDPRKSNFTYPTKCGNVRGGSMHTYVEMGVK
ncbi:hypothetical protein O3P69_014063 [Scylla paramamosain]|uniref:Uncharacterized protein n=1 Tax=Scylla paramamosain TaxID=85552 RepID=A0AAW0SR27_SCYPA